MEIWEYLLLFFSVFFGAGIAYVIRNNTSNFLPYALSFSGSYLLALVFTHLLPETFAHGGTDIGYYILGGFFLQLVLEQLSQGVEHGHIHHHHEGEDRGSFVIPLMIGLCFHSFLEGMPVSSYDSLHAGHDHGNALLMGIVFHKIPASFALTLLFLLSNFKKGQIVFLLTIFALMSPLGALIATQLVDNSFLQGNSMHNITGLVIGSFLHISTTILFETDTTRKHRITWQNLIAILAGVGIAIMSVHQH